ncbi:uncharacterized protein LOC124659386 [Lolium rigidum]|uniref:uncharacterized protein LOC124659386 n=1 Tax=Lolium rigidum TaxID=89674 RepID=UPI001F5CAAE6|nr:uncharacterized protein LOC124659386 [Lolium rigidum]
MAPPPQSTPRRAEGTRRSASSSSPSLCEESVWDSVIRAQCRRFSAQMGVLLLQFCPLSSSSGQTMPTSALLMPSPAVLRQASGANSTRSWSPTSRRTSDTIALALVRSKSTYPSPTCSSAIDAVGKLVPAYCLFFLTCTTHSTRTAA